MPPWSLTVTPEPQHTPIPRGPLHVAAKGASCDESDEGAQCHIHQQDWGIPIKQSPEGSKTVDLVLSGRRG